MVPRRLPRTRAFTASTMILVILVAACSGDDPTGLADFTLSATIDGTPWTATYANAVPSGSVIGVGAGDMAGIAMGFAFGAGGTGTYSIGPGELYNANYTVDGVAWAATPFQGSGSITVTSLTSSRVAGTFQFEGASVGQTPETTVSVTNGRFDLPLSSGG